MRAPDSNVSIVVDSGAVPEGKSQLFFFRVIYDESLLLQNVPEPSDSTLISPVIECGPADINLLKPVDVIVPHCLYLDEVKKNSISVYRCEHYSDRGDGNCIFLYNLPGGHSRKFRTFRAFLYILCMGMIPPPPPLGISWILALLNQLDIRHTNDKTTVALQTTVSVQFVNGSIQL